MSERYLVDDDALTSRTELTELLESSVTGKASPENRPDPTAVVVGELVGLTNDDRAPLVTYPGQLGTAAFRGRTVVDLHGAHVGKQVVLMFEGGNLERPLVMGVLREHAGWPLEQRPAHVEIDADGERMIVTAREQLVLRCGKASITLTEAGKVVIQGTYVSSRSSGLMRITGGSVELN